MAIPIRRENEECIFLFNAGSSRPVSGSDFEDKIKKWFVERPGKYPDVDITKGVYRLILNIKEFIDVINDRQHSLFAIQCENEHSDMTFKLSDIVEHSAFSVLLENKIPEALSGYHNQLSFFPLIECYGTDCLMMNYALQYPDSVREFLKKKWRGKIWRNAGDATSNKKHLIGRILTSNLNRFTVICDELLKQSHFVQVLSYGIYFYGPEEDLNSFKCLIQPLT